MQEWIRVVTQQREDYFIQKLHFIEWTTKNCFDVGKRMLRVAIIVCLRRTKIWLLLSLAGYLWEVWRWKLETLDKKRMDTARTKILCRFNNVCSVQGVKWTFKTANLVLSLLFFKSTNFYVIRLRMRSPTQPLSVNCKHCVGGVQGKLPRWAPCTAYY